MKYFLEKGQENGPVDRKKDETERAIGVSVKTRDQVVKLNQMIPLRFQTAGGWGLEKSDFRGLPFGSALQKSLLIFSSRSTTTVISDQTQVINSHAKVRLTVNVTRPLMVEGERGESEVDGTEKIDTAKTIFQTTAEASTVLGWFQRGY